MLEELQLDTEERLKAFTHPYRMKLIHVLRELHRPATATEVARVLGDGPGRVHYHMRILEDTGIVVLSHTETVNGIIARFYEPAAARYRVDGATLGADGEAHLRNEVERMVSLRFKDGLKAFLDRTTGECGPESSSRYPGSFLYDLNLHCTDEQWLEVRTLLEQLSTRFREPSQGSLPRHIFMAGATDFSGLRAGGSVADPGDGPSPSQRQRRHPDDPDMRWTFGISFMDSATRLRSTLPPL